MHTPAKRAAWIAAGMVFAFVAPMVLAACGGGSNNDRRTTTMMEEEEIEEQEVGPFAPLQVNVPIPRFASALTGDTSTTEILDVTGAGYQAAGDVKNIILRPDITADGNIAGGDESDTILIGLDEDAEDGSSDDESTVTGDITGGDDSDLIVVFNARIGTSAANNIDGGDDGDLIVIVHPDAVVMGDVLGGDSGTRADFDALAATSEKDIEYEGTGEDISVALPDNVDYIVIEDGTVNGNVDGGAGTDFILIGSDEPITNYDGPLIRGNVLGDAAADLIFLQAGVIEGYADGGAGDDAMSLDGITSLTYLDGGEGNNRIRATRFAPSGGFIAADANNDCSPRTRASGSISDTPAVICAGSGDDIIELLGDGQAAAVPIGGSVYVEGGKNVIKLGEFSDDVSTIVTADSEFAGAAIAGNILTGAGADVVLLAAGSITGDVSLGGDGDYFFMTTGTTVGGNIGGGGSPVLTETDILGEGTPGEPLSLFQEEVFIFPDFPAGIEPRETGRTDTLHIYGGTVEGNVEGGGGTDIILLGGAHFPSRAAAIRRDFSVISIAATDPIVEGNILGGADYDEITTGTGEVGGNIDGGGGGDTIFVIGTEITGYVQGGAGDDDITIGDEDEPTLVGSALYVDGGEDDDFIDLRVNFTFTANADTDCDSGTSGSDTPIVICGGGGTDSLDILMGVTVPEYDAETCAIYTLDDSSGAACRTEVGPPGRTTIGIGGFERLSFSPELQLYNALVPALQSLGRQMLTIPAHAQRNAYGLWVSEQTIKETRTGQMTLANAPSSLIAYAEYEQDIHLMQQGIMRSFWRDNTQGREIRGGASSHILQGVLRAADNEVYFDIEGYGAGAQLEYRGGGWQGEVSVLGAWFSAIARDRRDKQTDSANGTHFLATAEFARALNAAGLDFRPYARAFWQKTIMRGGLANFASADALTGEAGITLMAGSHQLGARLVYDGGYVPIQTGLHHSFRPEPAFALHWQHEWANAANLSAHTEAGWRRGLKNDSDSAYVSVRARWMY